MKKLWKVAILPKIDLIIFIRIFRTHTTVSNGTRRMLLILGTAFVVTSNFGLKQGNNINYSSDVSHFVKGSL